MSCIIGYFTFYHRNVSLIDLQKSVRKMALISWFVQDAAETKSITSLSCYYGSI